MVKIPEVELDKVKDLIFKAWGDSESAALLRSNFKIIELHNPVCGQANQLICSHCSEISDKMIDYPCMSVEIILKELKY